MTTVRKKLAACRPHVSLKEAWKAVIQNSRRRKRDGLEAPLSSRSAVDRLLQTSATPEMDVTELKSSLRSIIDARSPEDADTALEEIEQWAAHHTPKVHKGDVRVLATILDAQVEAAAIDLWLNTRDRRRTLDAPEASRFIHLLHGREVAGSRLTIEAELEPGWTLPTVERAERARQRTPNQSSWLPFLDPAGRYSATPRSIAERHAHLLRAHSVVLDPFCGAGGDAIAFAQSGIKVLASDHNAGRLTLAKQNASHFGVTERIEFTFNEALNAVTAGLDKHPEAAIFLDPPWGGTDWNKGRMTFEALFQQLPEIIEACETAETVLIKLPRTLDVKTLPGEHRQWKIELGLDSRLNEPIDRLKTLIAIGIRCD